jgi:iron complex outermembrane recepter protein
MKKLFVNALLASSVWSIAMPAFGQNTQNVSADPAQEASSETVIVTARRREETLQSAPLAISAFSATTLRNAQVRSVQDLQQLVPALNLTGRSSTRPQQYLRGIGTDQFTNAADPAIGVFVDDVYIARASGVLTALADLERVEVLRGPQGTLYGRNTTGGAIRLITAAPTRELRVIGEVGVGSFNARSARVTISGPLSESLSARITGSSRRDDGYFTNTATGKTTGGDNTLLFDGKLLFEPNENLSVTLGLLHVTTDTGGEQAQTTGARPTLVSPRAPDAIIPTDPFRGAYNVDSTIGRESTQLSLRAISQLGFGELTSISAYRSATTDELFDQDASNLDIWTQDSAERSKTFTQEIRLASIKDGPLTFNGRVSWIVGAFYLQEDGGRFTRTGFGPDSVSVLLARSRGLIAGNRYDATTDFSIVTESIAAFGSASFEVFKSFNLTIGGRATRDKKTADFIGITGALGVPPAPASFTVRDRTEEWTSVDPKVGFDWKVSNDVLLFGSWSTGFRSGGFQALPTSAEIASQAYDPEQLNALEAGIKTTWANGRTTLNATGFRYRYDDLQSLSIRALPGGVLQTRVDNAARATLQGFELEARSRFSDWLNIGASYAYLDATYDTFINPPLPNLDGSRLPRTPEHQFRLDATATMRINDSQKLLLRGDFVAFSEQFLAVGEGQIPNTFQPDYSLTNISLSWELGDGKYAATAYVKNAADTLYLGAANFFGGPPAVSYYAPPRTWGVQFRLRLD